MRALVIVMRKRGPICGTLFYLLSIDISPGSASRIAAMEVAIQISSPSCCDRHRGFSLGEPLISYTIIVLGWRIVRRLEFQDQTSREEWSKETGLGGKDFWQR